MIHKLMTVAFLFLTCSIAQAQCLPPRLDDPQSWEIHNEDGPMGLQIHVEYLYSYDNVDVFELTCNGVTSTAYQEFSEDGTTCDVDVLNGDSGNWTEWHWQGDCFEKVGGTHHQRWFYPNW